MDLLMAFKLLDMAQQRWRRLDGAHLLPLVRAGTGILLFLVVSSAYYISPIRYSYDSSYSLLMDEAILQHGTPNLLCYQVGRGRGGNFSNHGYLYMIDLVKGRLLYIFPWGGALLSLPAVAALNVGGLEVAPHGIYNAGNDLKMQTVIATVLCAGIIWIFYQAANALLPIPWSLGLALSAAFATPIWSTASRSLWAQTWYLFLISLVIWLLISNRMRPVLLGTLLGWAYFVCPQSLPAIVLISLYVLVEYKPKYFAAFVFTGAAWAVAAAGTMIFFFAHLLPPSYQAQVFDFRHGLMRLAGLLLSPSRGLFVFVPIVLLPLYVMIRYWSVFPRKRLALLALAVIVSHIVITALWGAAWWGGWSYGPRLLIETVPWFVLLAILGVRTFLDKPVLSYQRFALVGVAAALLFVSVAINAVGAFSQAANDWNGVPNIDFNPERVWDWRHPQFLAWLTSPESWPRVSDKRPSQKRGRKVISRPH
jgi:hypothetical protein